MLAQAEPQQHQQQQQQMMGIKGKRTKRPRPISPFATSSSGLEDSTRLVTSSSSTTTTANVESGYHLCNSSTITTEEEEDMACCLILLAQGGTKLFSKHPASQQQENSPSVYECKTCNRCFPSFQALGGHRASHKKPKPTSPVEENGQFTSIQGAGLSLQSITCNSPNTLSASNNDHKLKVHACGICGSEFSSGQALGGHMRRHRSLIATPATPPTIQEPAPAPARSLQLCLDLNLPAEDEQQDQLQSPKFLFGSNDNTLVFAGALVDCRY